VQAAHPTRRRVSISSRVSADVTVTSEHDPVVLLQTFEVPAKKNKAHTPDSSSTASRRKPGSRVL
jgi:hypothetical protein